jgi:hypothetical protein
MKSEKSRRKLPINGENFKITIRRQQSNQLINVGMIIE